MKKGLKILSVMSLLSTLTIAGCSCSKDDLKNVSRMENSGDSILGNLSEDASNYTLLNVYNSLIASNEGNTVVAKKLVDFIGSEVLELNKDESVWKKRYEELVKEKMTEKAKGTEESNYKVKGEFSEKYFIESLQKDGYKITCPASVVYGSEDNLACDYSNFIDQEIKTDVISTLLKQKYILDEILTNRKNVLTNKKIRDVEYITLSSGLDSQYKDLSVRDFVRDIRNSIANNEVVDLKTVAENFKTELKAIVTKEYEKIGTDQDSSGTINSTYTGNSTYDAKIGYDKKISEIDNKDYYFEKIITADSGSASVISESITSILLSITNTESADSARKVVKVTDSNSNTYYYLVSPNAGTTITANDVLLSESSDGSTFTYSIVRMRVIDSDTTDENDIYEAVKVLANESTLASGALAHYIKEKKDTISVYDDDVITYLETLYPDVFAE